MPTPIMEKVFVYSFAASVLYLIQWEYASAFSIGMVVFYVIGLQFTTIYDAKTTKIVGIGVTFRPWWRKK